MDNSYLSTEMEKTELILILVISNEIKQLAEENYDEFLNYVDSNLKPYNDDTLLDPYIVLSAEEAINEYEENKDDYPDESEFYMKFYGGYKDDDGNIMCQINENGIFSSYKIQNENNELCKSAGDIIEMILEEKISFNYILYNNKMYNKADTKLILPDCNENSYFVVIKCYD